LIDALDWKSASSIQELPVQSAILEPSANTVLDGDDVAMKGYAWSGGGRAIERVDVSADGGTTWIPARIVQRGDQPDHKSWAWCFWEANVELPPVSTNVDGVTMLVCKAVDRAYNAQPDSFEGVYNRRGVLSNAWHRIPVQRVKSEE
jgi:sulfite oxidase